MARERLAWLMLPVAVAAILGLWHDGRQRSAGLAATLAAERETLAWLKKAAAELGPPAASQPTAELATAELAAAVVRDAGLPVDAITTTAPSAREAVATVDGLPAAAFFGIIHRLMAHPGLRVHSFSARPVPDTAGRFSGRIVVRVNR